MLLNDEIFVEDLFNEDSIKKSSRIINYQVPEDTPVWIDQKIKKELLSDET